jgi:hypothetical protein
VCESRDIVVARVDVSSSAFAHMPNPTNHPRPLNYLPNHVQPLTHLYPLELSPNHLQPDRHPDNFDTRIGCFARFTNCASSTTSLLGSAGFSAAGLHVPAAAADTMYGYPLPCTTAPSVLVCLLCDERALQCPPYLVGRDPL